jgi:hypothetical protein
MWMYRVEGDMESFGELSLRPGIIGSVEVAVTLVLVVGDTEFVVVACGAGRAITIVAKHPRNTPSIIIPFKNFVIKSMSKNDQDIRRSKRLYTILVLPCIPQVQG